MDDITTGHVHLVLEHVYTFADALSALEKTETRHARGKLVVVAPNVVVTPTLRTAAGSIGQSARSSVYPPLDEFVELPSRSIGCGPAGGTSAGRGDQIAGKGGVAPTS